MVLDQATALQLAGSRGDTDAANPEHVGQELVRDPKGIAVGAIVAHQQPTGQTRSDLVKAQADGRGRELRHQDGDVAFEDAAERRALRQLDTKCDLADSQGAAAALHHCVQGRGHDAESQLRPEHAFASDHADFDARAPRHDGDQRDEAVDGKVDVARRRRRLADGLTERQIDRLAP